MYAVISFSCEKVDNNGKEPTHEQTKRPPAELYETLMNATGRLLPPPS